MATLTATLQQATHTDSQSSTASVPQYSKTSYVLAATGSSSRIRRTYLKFDLSSIPKGSTITSATLSLYSYDADMNWQASVALVARRVTSSWDQTTITHNSQPSNTSTSQASGTFSGYNKWYDFNATSLVQSIVNSTNYGIVVMANNESTGSLTKAFRCRTKAGTSYATSWHANAPKLTVEYTAPSVTVTFYGNGATGTGANTGNTSTNLSDLKQTVTYSSAYTAFDLYNVESLFTRTGYVKASAAQAWRVGSATSTTYMSDSSADFTSYLAGGTQTLKLYANWRGRNYVLTVKYQNGLPDHVTDGSSSKPHLIYGEQNWNYLTPNLTRVGYTFTGYYDAPSGGIQVYDTSGYRIKGTPYWDSNGNYCYTGDMTVYAQWAVNSYTVTFDTNGGELPNGVTTQSITTPYGNQLVDLPIPTRQGYRFKGWYVNFDGNNFINYGADYKYTDKLSVHLTAYMDNWADYWDKNYRLISCTETGGWNIEPTNGFFNFVVYSAADSAYKSATSPVEPAFLDPGWHDFDIVFPGMGESVRGYIDGELVATGEPFSGDIGYNALNPIFLGAEAAKSQTEPTPEISYFVGKIGNVIISNEDTVYPINTYNKMTAPAQDITLYARWEQGNFTVHFDSNGGTSNDLSSLSQEFEYSVDAPLSIPDPYNFNVFSFGKTPITEAEWNTQPDGSGMTIGINDTISSLSLESLTEENGSSLTFYINWRPAGKVCVFTAPTKKTFVYPQIFNGETWVRAMAAVYNEATGRWKFTVEPIGDWENYQIIYPDVHPAGSNLNIYTDSETDTFYPAF